MAKFHGIIGYTVTTNPTPGVWVDDITERPYKGDMSRNVWRLETSDGVNDNVNISNEISIVADPFAYDNFHSIKYVAYGGVKWKVSSVELRRPRLILTVGGVYNGQ